MDKNTSNKNEEIKMPKTRKRNFDDTNELENTLSRTKRYQNVMDESFADEDFADEYEELEENFAENSPKDLETYDKSNYNSESNKKAAFTEENSNTEELDEELEEITTQFKLPDFNSHTKSIQFSDNEMRAIKNILESDKKDMKKQETKNVKNNSNNNNKETTVKKKKLRLNRRTLASLLLLIVAIPVLAFSGYQVFNYFTYESPKTKDLINDAQDKANIDEDHVPDPDKVEIPETEEHPDTPYWNYIKMNLIDVDFTELKKINSDTVGWVTVGGTNVNYPVVQTTDNDYYLTHSLDKSKNSAGWVFMDYRNTGDDYGRNTIIYGHNRKDKTMFGTLKNVLSRDWYNNLDNRVIKMSTESYNTLWQIYSVYTLETTNDYIKTDFANDQEYQDFINLVKGRSTANFNTTVTTKDKTLTLSTCHGSSKKLVIHAKLIKTEAR